MTGLFRNFRSGRFLPESRIFEWGRNLYVYMHTSALNERCRITGVSALACFSRSVPKAPACCFSDLGFPEPLPTSLVVRSFPTPALKGRRRFFSSYTGMERANQTTVSSAQLKYLIVEKLSDAPAVVIIKINRPNSLNALCLALCDELVQLLEQLDADDSVRCVVLTGVGEKAFAAGADVKEMQRLDFADIVTSGDLLAKWARIHLFRKPIVCAVNAYALGGGCELAMMCDVVIASTQAMFGQPEVRIGTIPGMGGSQRLPRAVGKSLAMEMILTGEPINAERALQAGLISRVVPPSHVVDEAVKIATSISGHSLPILIAAKECVNRAYEMPLQEGLLFERRLFHGTFAYEDRKEGMTAFVEKRTPQWHHK
ncbi:UNVERIFIED_CONTAM: enoyl-CoA hydratase/isomerase family protein [Hammondia hammondi]|eukprot:XP_008888881.1 enoyl-CoA hydratase/isomerase family protein [Hammondia hammondi]